MLIEAEAIPSLGAAFDCVEVGSYQGDRCEIVLLDASKRFVIEQKLPAIGRLIEQIVGSEVRVTLSARESAPEETQEAKGDGNFQSAANHPLVRQAQDLFDARIVSVEPDRDSD